MGDTFIQDTEKDKSVKSNNGGLNPECNSWLLYEAYGDDFIGCPEEDYEEEEPACSLKDKATDQH